MGWVLIGGLIMKFVKRWVRAVNHLDTYLISDFPFRFLWLLDCLFAEDTFAILDFERNETTFF